MDPCGLTQLGRSARDVALNVAYKESGGLDSLRLFASALGDALGMAGAPWAAQATMFACFDDTSERCKQGITYSLEGCVPNDRVIPSPGPAVPLRDVLTCLCEAADTLAHHDPSVEAPGLLLAPGDDVLRTMTAVHAGLYELQLDLRELAGPCAWWYRAYTVCANAIRVYTGMWRSRHRHLPAVGVLLPCVPSMLSSPPTTTPRGDGGGARGTGRWTWRRARRRNVNGN